ncbi:MAG: type III pantothenate kinase [Bacteroidota bacterium]
MTVKGVIDNGNTRCKAGLFKDGDLIVVKHFSNLQEAFEWLKDNGVTQVMVSSVRADQTFNTTLEYYTVNKDLKLPFVNLYKTPETLGADRIAAMAAAAVLYPDNTSLVFDIGTCMTIDFLNERKEYNGGNISPGLNMRLKAMNQMTGRLPLSSVDEIQLPMGNSTLSALANGAMLGLQYEIDGYIQSTLEKNPDTCIVLCGGDAHYFEKPLKYKIFANPNLVLQGLYHLLILNAKS